MIDPVVDELLRGSADAHIHAGPNYIPRSVDMVEAAREACAAGQRAIVIKDHHMPTVAATRIVQRHFVGGDGFRIFGALALNNHVGGLNLKALEIALLMDVKVVWMPTVSCDNHYVKHHQGGLAFPKSEKRELQPESYMTLIDGAGELIPEAAAVVEEVARHPSVVLATGHGTADEVDAIVRKAAACGAQRVVATHPAYMVDASIEQMRRWAAAGAYVELCATTSYSGSKFFTVTPERTVEIIRTVGPERILLSSDMGQVGNPHPVEGMALWLRELLDHGVQVEEIRTMFHDNAARLLDLE